MIVPIEKPGTPAELVHAGVKGMRWGFRKKEETAGPGKPKQEEPKKEHHLSKKQKGAIAVVAILAAYGAYKFVDSGHAHQLMMSGREFVTGQNLGFSRNRALAGKMTPEQIMGSVVSGVNPHYGEVGSKNNCLRCTMAYEMRRRGFDVQATRSLQGTGQTRVNFYNARNKNFRIPTNPLTVMGRVYREGPEGFNTVNTAVYDFHDLGIHEIGSHPDMSKAVFGALAKEPEGARGNLSVAYQRTGGQHSLAWEIIGGKPAIFDTQIGRGYTDPQAFAKHVGLFIARAGISRLDNQPLDEAFLRRWVQNA